MGGDMTGRAHHKGYGDGRLKDLRKLKMPKMNLDEDPGRSWEEIQESLDKEFS